MPRRRRVGPGDLAKFQLIEEVIPKMNEIERAMNLHQAVEINEPGPQDPDTVRNAEIFIDGKLFLVITRFR